jgi:hypothetical protein
MDEKQDGLLMAPPKLRFNLLDLFLLVAIAAGAFATYRAFWNPQLANHHQLLLGLHLAVVSLATAGVFSDRPIIRWRCLAMAIFGWSYFAFVLQGGFGVETASEAELLARNAKVGLAFVALTGLAAIMLSSVLGKKQPIG